MGLLRLLRAPVPLPHLGLLSAHRAVHVVSPPRPRAHSNENLARGAVQRARLKACALVTIASPAAVASLCVRAVAGESIAGGEGALPVVVTIAHCCSVALAAALLIEAAARCFEVLSLLSCRSETLLEIKCEDDDDERESRKEDMVAFDLRTAEGSLISEWGLERIAWLPCAPMNT